MINHNFITYLWTGGEIRTENLTKFCIMHNIAKK